MDNSKQQLIDIIKQWVKNDNEIRELQKQQNIRKKQKTELSSKLIEIMKNNEIDEFDIKGGKISYIQKTVKRPITQKYLLELLARYYNGDNMKAIEVNSFLQENREEIIKENIIRTIEGEK